MKRIIFISRSKLSQNLMEIIIKSINKKIDYKPLSSLKELSKAHYSRPVQIVIVDNNAVRGEKTSDTELFGAFESRYFVKSKKIFLHTRKDAIDRDLLERHGFGVFLVKPFLTEELIDIITTGCSESVS
ncbi:MAG: hypothetical protein HQM16_05480 [Deltaproteobacteria bacterium]|nr:hypothetical protein [Deltaproteobacteria bacterium]